MSVTPGSKISVELTARPTNAAAVKTIIRLFRKDAGVSRFQRQLGRTRPSMQSWRRGGNYWHHQMKTLPPVKLEIGQKYTISATVDVIRDLASVDRFVKVSAAK